MGFARMIDAGWAKAVESQKKSAKALGRQDG